MINSPEAFIFPAKRTLLSSNLKPLNVLGINRLKSVVSPHKIQGGKDISATEFLRNDLAAINDFLHFVEAEPYLTIEKAPTRKRLSLNKH